MNSQQRMAEAKRLSLLANKSWMSEHRELLANFEPDSLWRAIGAFIQLEPEVRAEIATVTPSIESYKSIISRAFMYLYQEGSISPTFPLTKLGEQSLNLLRRQTGLGIENLPVPEPVLTAEQRLEAEVENDWRTLSSAQIRKKRDSSRQYAACLDRLLNSDRLSSQITANPVMH